jgi:hypothetical protein
MALQYDTTFYGADTAPFLSDGKVQKYTILFW